MLEKLNVPAVVRFGPFTLDRRTGELRNGQTRLRIPDQSLSILQALLERPGELVSREALRDRLPDAEATWPGLAARVRSQGCARPEERPITALATDREEPGKSKDVE